MTNRLLDDPVPEASAARPAVVVADGLTKTYGKRTVVDRLSFTIPTGSVTGLVGPNGAGKTTLMAMLLGLVRPSGGAATVLGHPVRQPGAYLDRVGALIEGPAFHPGVSGRTNLRSLAILGGHDAADVDALLGLVGLEGCGEDRYGTYSLGMKQRLGIAGALLGDPRLVVLDEPTNGLDPVGMQDMRRLISEIAAEGRTVLVSSHLLGELEQVCDWLVVIDRGGLVHAGPPETLAGTGDRLTLRPADVAQLDDLAHIAASGGLPTTTSNGSVILALDDSVEPHRLAAELNLRAHAAGITLVELHRARTDLETRYLDLVNGGTR